MDLVKSIGNILKRRKKLPPFWDRCQVCGSPFPSEQLHKIIMFFGSKNEEFLICESCSDLPPSIWAKRVKERRLLKSKKRT